MSITVCFKKENRIIVGNNKDTFIPTGMLFTNHRNINKKAMLFPPEKPYEWTSSFGSLTFSQCGKEFPSSGINEIGLVAEQMIFPQTVYPQKDDREAIKEFQWIQMILDTCKTVDEAIQIAKKIRISQSIWPVHFFICDASGNYRILEYQHGDLHIFGNDHKQIPVLTNSSYQESLSCLDGKEYVDELVDPYRYQSIDRFLKAKILVSKANDFIGSPENTGFNILSQVATPDTLWGFVYNASHPSLQVKDFVNKSKAIFSLNDFDFSIEAPWKLMEICSKRDILCDLTMQDYSFNMNKKMVESFFNNKHVIAQIGYHVPVEGIMHYSIYPEKLS